MAEEGEGNRIVTPPKEATSFPMLIIAGLIVTAGIYLAADWNPRAAWLIAFLVLLGVAFRYKHFGDEITGLLSNSTPATNQQTPPNSVTPPATIDQIVIGQGSIPA